MTTERRGQVAIVTGAGSGIGAATAELLAANKLKLVLNGRTESKLMAVEEKIKNKYPDTDIKIITGDVSQAKDCETLVADTIKAFGRCDILINNAGIATKSALLTEISEDDIHKTIDINLKGAIFMMQAVLRQWMVPNQHGVIININSISGKTAFPYWSIYDASKFGLRAITEAVAEEQNLNNIKVTGIYPGATATDIWDQIDLDTNPDRQGMVDPQSIAEAVWYVLQQPKKLTIPELTITPLKPAL